MLAPQTVISARLVTIAEPEPTNEDPHWDLVPYLECALCEGLFEDGEPAYNIGSFPGIMLHVGCV